MPATNGRLDVENEVARSSIGPFPFPNTPEPLYTPPMLAEAPSSERNPVKSLNRRKRGIVVIDAKILH